MSTTSTKERPILFSAPMVRAILDGRKTQTRRMVKGLIEDGAIFHPREICDQPGWWTHNGRDFLCPYGQPGDRLWVKEVHYRFGHWEVVPGVQTKGGRDKWRFTPDSEQVLYDAPATFRTDRYRSDSATPAWHSRRARFMPRSLSRLTLEVTGVRAERLQDISWIDAIAEGIKDPRRCAKRVNLDFGCVAQFRALWDSINRRGSWDANPWVWVVKFRRIEP